MTRVLLVLAVGAVAAVVAAIVARRRPDAPTRTGRQVPDQLDRSDFGSPQAPWLVVLFSSATCHACAEVKAKALVLASSDVVVREVPYESERALHDRYRIDAVPILLVADAAGIVRRSYLGPVSATHLWADVAALRESA